MTFRSSSTAAISSRALAGLLAASMASAAVSCTSTMGGSTGEKLASEAAPAPIPRRRGYAAADGGARIYYEVCGSGPAIVFIHGLGGNHAVWFQQVAHFARNHTVVTISQRGFAPSGGDPNHYNVDLLVHDLEDVLEAAGIEKAVVVGQSMGGWTALNTALVAPERVEALVLADTIAGIHDDQIAAALREVAASAARLRRKPPPLGVHPALGEKFSAERPDLAYLYQTLTTFGAPAPDVIVKQLFAARFGADRLAGLRVPTLFLVGSEDRLFPPALLERASTYIEGSSVVVVPGAGHSPYFETPAEWNAALEAFLARP